MTIQQAFELALQHHRAGRLAEAEAIYREILAIQPRHADALHLRGVIAHQSGRHDVAVDLIRQAIALQPDAASFHSNLGESYRMHGRMDEAVAAFRRALKLKPDYAEACNNLGNALTELGKLDEAIAICRRAVELEPGYAEAHNTLGSALLQQGRVEQAVASCRSALRCDPGHAQAHNNLGNALAQQGLLDDAIAAFQRALELRPEEARMHSNLASALTHRGRLEEAARACLRALALNPRLAEAENNLGAVLTQQGKLDEAAATLCRAIQLKPDNAKAHSNLGNVHMERGQITEAIAEYRRALQLKPDCADAHSNLLLNLHYLHGVDAQALFEEHCHWGRTHAPAAGKGSQPLTNGREPERRLRIGYVSPDFREHSVAYFLEDLLACHDPAQVEIFCYSSLNRPDAAGARLQRLAAHWSVIQGLSDAQVAERICADRIDILVDLAGHSAGNRLPLFALRPAPVQVTWLGYPGTTGLEAMDYRLTDALADPPGTTEHLHTEKLIRLPDCAWCFRPSEEAPPVAPPPAFHSGRVTFGSFNMLPKITAAMLEHWSAILRAVPGSRLLLKNRSLQDASARAFIRDTLAGFGIAAERIEMACYTTSPGEHLALYGSVDVALDTFPYHGTTTTCEALWMGVPVITLAGKTHVSRVGASLLGSIGLAELVAHDPPQYIRLATELALDPSRLAALRAGLRERMVRSPLRAGPRFARGVEHAYREMWRAWCAG